MRLPLGHVKVLFEMVLVMNGSSHSQAAKGLRAGWFIRNVVPFTTPLILLVGMLLSTYIDTRIGLITVATLVMLTYLCVLLLYCLDVHATRQAR